MDDIAGGDETHSKDRNPSEENVALVFRFVSAELIHQVTRSNVEQDHHHANEELVGVDCIQN